MTPSRMIWVVLTALLACAPEPGPIATSRQASQAKVQFNRNVLLHSLSQLGFDTELDTARMDRVRAEFIALPCAVPDEVALAFALHPVAGPDPNSDVGRWLEASVAHAAYDSLRRTTHWRPNWIPLIRRPVGWLVVESSRGTSPAGPVLEVTDDGQARVFGVNLSVLTEEWTRD